MGNISGGELVILAFLALLLVGPDRLPQYAQQLGKLVRTIREMMSGAKETLKEELGDDYEELQKFDPRQYDPRRIVRDALNDPTPARGAGPGRSQPKAQTGFRTTTPRGTTVSGGAALAGAAAAGATVVSTSEKLAQDSKGAEASHPPFDDEAT